MIFSVYTLCIAYRYYVLVIAWQQGL